MSSGDPGSPYPGQYPGGPPQGGPYPTGPQSGGQYPGGPPAGGPYPGQPYPGQPYPQGPQPGPYGYPQQQPSADPAPGGGYGFGPFAPGGPPPAGTGYPAPGGPYAPAPPPPRRRSRLPLLIVGGVVVALVAVIAVVAAVTRDTPSATPTGRVSLDPAGPATGAAPPAARPSDAVANFLSALAANNAAAATAYAADPVDAGPFLSNAVLAESNKRAPLTAIQVPVVDDQQATTVQAAYAIGRTRVTATYGVVKVGDEWKLTDALKEIDLSLLRDSSLGMRINGVKVTSDTVSLLPGSYAFTTGQRLVSYGSKSVVLIKSPTASLSSLTLRTQLTPAGKKAAVSAARKSYRGCLKSHRQQPKNCPNSSTSKYTYSRVTWKQIGKDPFRRAKVAYVGGAAQVDIKLGYRLSGPCTYKGQSGTCTGSLTGGARALVTVLKKRPTVRWL